MTAQAKFSAKGQIVIPKDVRDRYAFANGQVVDVVELPDGVMLRAPSRRGTMSADQAKARLRKIFRYEGPVLPIEALSWRPGINAPDTGE